MKIQNRKTGEIRNAVDIDMYTDSVYLKVSDGEFDNETIEYHSLAELNEEWEDYKPEGWWFIDRAYEPHATNSTLRNLEADRQIGNYFETKEEAESAVRKLEALKRLEDNGFEITGWKFTPDMKHTKGNFVTIKAEIPYIVENQADLDLLFSGGEE